MLKTEDPIEDLNEDGKGTMVREDTRNIAIIANVDN